MVQEIEAGFCVFTDAEAISEVTKSCPDWFFCHIVVHVPIFAIFAYILES